MTLHIESATATSLKKKLLALPLLVGIAMPVALSPTPAAAQMFGGAHLVRQAEHVDRSTSPRMLTVSTHRRVRHTRRVRSKKKSAVIIGGSTLGGAVVGGLVGGKKGALIGGAAGAGGGYLYDRKTNGRH
jgi:outer membrane lipoprotein SlyB